MTDQVDLLESVLDKTGRLIAGVPAGSGAGPTPCPDYDIATLVEHLVTWVARFADAAEGRPSGEPGTDPSPDESSSGGSSSAEPSSVEPAEAFRSAAQRAVAAFRGGAVERTVSLAGGELPGSAAVGMMLMEYIGHGWDLATATGQPVPYDADEAAAALQSGQRMLLPDYRGPGKAFGHEVSVPADADGVRRLIGFLGRDPAWTPPQDQRSST